MAENTRPLMVFNPHSWDVVTNVELEIGTIPPNPMLVDDAGEAVPMQFVQSHATANGRRRLSFTASLPALGYRTYHMIPGEETRSQTPLIASQHTLENEYLRLVINPDTGCIQSLYDKENELDIFNGEAARPVVIDDQSDTWSHNVFQFHDVAGHFHAERVHLVTHGPAKATLRVYSAYGQSRLIQEFSMFPGQKRVDVQVTIDWREEFKMLKLRFPVYTVFNRVTYEIPYGHIERPANGEEEPGQSWIDVSGAHRLTNDMIGLSILNDGKYSFDVLNREIGLTVLRSPIYAHHDPKVPSDDESYTFIDQGIQRFRYVLMPHTGGWEDAQTPRRAAELNQPPVPLLVTFHDGPLSQSQTFASVDAPNIIISAIKQAEDSEDMIIRAYETDRRATSTLIKLPVCNRTIEAQFDPCEIKTFRIPRQADQPVVETNLLEWQDEDTGGRAE